MARVKLSDIKDEGKGKGDFKPCPVGDYVVKVEEIKKGESKAGNQKAELTFVVVQGKFRKRKFWDTLVYKENCVWKFKQFLTGIRIPDVGLIEIDFTEAKVFHGNGKPIEAKEIIGKICMVSVDIEKNNKGKDHNVITKIYEADAGVVEELEAGDSDLDL